MPPFIKQVLAVLVQMAVAWAAGWIAAHGGPSFTSDQVTKFVADATPVVVVVVWAIWTKYRGSQKLLVAQASPGPLSDHEITQAVKAGAAPSVLTASHEVPSLKA